MESTKKNRFIGILAVSLLLFTAAVNLIGILVVTPLQAQNTANGTKAARLNVTVMEALVNTPLADATVCIIETGAYYQTDKDGKTGSISVPVLRNTNFDKTYRRPYGEITLFVYKDGYIDYILFYVMVYENKERNGPNIYLYATDDPANALTHSLVEGPDNEWVNELIRKYRK